MQAVILAGGKGTRMGGLTENMPKPMLKVLGKNLIEHKLDALPDSVTEVIIVVGYKKEAITGYFGDSYKGRKIVYVEQGELLGTGHALWQAKNLITGKFIVMMGDDIYCKSDIDRLVMYDWGVLVDRCLEKNCSGGRVFTDENGYVSEVLEGAHSGDGVLLSTAMYVLTKDIFKYELVKIPGRDEYGLPQTIVTAKKDFPIKAVESVFWLQITGPKDLKRAETVLSSAYRMADPIRIS